MLCGHVYSMWKMENRLLLFGYSLNMVGCVCWLRYCVLCVRLSLCKYSYSNHSIFRSHTIKAYYGAYIYIGSHRIFELKIVGFSHICESSRLLLTIVSHRTNNKSIIASVYREHSYDIDVPNHIYHQIPFWKFNQARFSTSILFIAIERKGYRVKPKNKNKRQNNTESVKKVSRFGIKQEKKTSR